ncbi:hypothetical protein E1161_04235 [Saccharopolyspora aridisoli]|uniref:Uncharacterized protein n=1 Tax=Saccharopolyspora aridisoli TaxID=2530385 RepID=A0A4R4V2A7_9PSEU|nr:hypothetical protein [Saccharopolyspora aridisoli]TDC95403.1 hypothetical protein E1161_04235 [Saccharopolyspora aridisoli]
MVSDTAVQLDHDERHLWVRAPHHRGFAAARKLGGEFDGATKSWTFDIGHADEVAALCREIYGTDGTPGQLVTITVDLDAYRKHADDPGELYITGRRVLRRPSRDAPVRYGPDITVATGGFPASGGTHRLPRLEAARGTILEVRDVPAAHPDLTKDGIAVLDQARDIAALHAERALLIERITEIDAQLAEAQHERDDEQEGTAP